MQDEIYQMYLEELKEIKAYAPEEEETLLAALLSKAPAARRRLIEGNLRMALELAGEYEGRGLPLGDLIQEANVALALFLEEYKGGDFRGSLEARMRAGIEEALKIQETEHQVEEQIAARVNVLQKVSSAMAEELGREATVAELAVRMKMTEEEIKDIMKLTLDALSLEGI